MKELSAPFPGKPRSLLPSPVAGSACKRLNLFLRWMVRRDEVDPGGWDHVPPSKLIVPLDIHMHRISLQLGLTGRKQANLKAACEITNAFRAIEPDDPVRYDFSLTRLGIRDDLTPDGFSCGLPYQGGHGEGGYLVLGFLSTVAQAEQPSRPWPGTSLFSLNPACAGETAGRPPLKMTGTEARPTVQTCRGTPLWVTRAGTGACPYGSSALRPPCPDILLAGTQHGSETTISDQT